MKTFTGYQRGVNFGGWLSQCRHTKEHYRDFITEKDFAVVAAWGMDHVRIPFDYELIETAEGEYIEDGFEILSKCITWCKKYGLHLILDLHRAFGYSFGQFKTSSFFSDHDLQKRFTRLWSSLAKRFGNNADMLAFELLNEIVDYNVADAWNKIAEEAIKEIRKFAPEIKILVGGVCYNHVKCVSLLDAPYDDNIVYNFHCYETQIFTHQGAGWMGGMPVEFRTGYPQRISDFDALEKEVLGYLMTSVDQPERDVLYSSEVFENLFADAVAHAEKYQVPLYCGEFGVIDFADTKSTLRWFEDITGAFRKNGIGHAIWTYKRMNFGITDEHYQEILDTLVTL